MKRIALLVPFALPIRVKKISEQYYTAIRLHVTKFYAGKGKCRIETIYCKLGQICPPDYDVIIVPLVTELDAIAHLPDRKTEDVIYLDHYDQIDRVYQLTNFVLDEETIKLLDSRLNAVHDNPKLPQLFHISRDVANVKNLNLSLPSIIQPYIPKRIKRRVDGVSAKWVPRQPIFDDFDEESDLTFDAENYDPIYAERLPPRICFSDNMQGCFSGIYPNFSNIFDGRKQGDLHVMEFFVYCPLSTKDKHYYTPERLQKDRLVWDAHLTREYCTLEPTEMMRYPLKLRICFTLDRGARDFLKIKPFNDSNRELEWHSPIIKASEWFKP